MCKEKLQYYVNNQHKKIMIILQPLKKFENFLAVIISMKMNEN